MLTIKRVAYLWALAALLLPLSGLAAAEPGDAGWVNVTNNVGGEKWGAYGVTYMQAVPGSNEVIAGVSERGLWLSADRGATWRRLSDTEMKYRPGRIVFDPKNPAVFWASGCYGDAPFKTEDGGKTFQRLGKLAHADGVAIDFTDPARKTLLLGLHEQSQSVQLSRDGGNTWTKIGANSAGRQQPQHRPDRHRLEDVPDQYGRLEAQGNAGHLPHRRRRPDLDEGVGFWAAGTGTHRV